MSASSPSYLQVVVLFNGKLLNTHVFTEPEVVIGRGTDCQIVLDNPGASRQHAKLVRDAGQIRLIDLQSGNGTTVNGKPVIQAVIKPNDVIAISKFTLTAKLTDAPAKVSAPPAATAAGGPHFGDEHTVFLSAQDRARIVEQAQPGARPTTTVPKPAAARVESSSKVVTVIIFVVGAIAGIALGWFLKG